MNLNKRKDCCIRKRFLMRQSFCCEERLSRIASKSFQSVLCRKICYNVLNVPVIKSCEKEGIRKP